MTVRHLFRSRELTTMLNTLGHSEAYRFALGLETAIAKVLHGSSNLLSTQIVVNPAAIAKEMQESSTLLSLQIVVNHAAIAKASEESSNLLSPQIVIALRPLPKHCGGRQTFCHSDSWKPCAHCQSIAGIHKPSVHSDSWKHCGHCQSITGVLKPSVPSDSRKPCGHC